MKTVMILIAGMIILNNCYSQALIPFPEPGMKQGCVYSGDFTTGGKKFNASMTYLYDTLLNGYMYSRFYAKYSMDFYTRYEYGKIYKVMANSDGSFAREELLQYDFSLNLNDTFPSKQLGPLRVDSVSTITLLNGQNRKIMKLVGAAHWSSSRIYYWIDGIGDITRGFLYPSDFEGGYGIFVCHWNNTGLVYQKQPVVFNCDTLLGITNIPIIYRDDKLIHTINPNPSNGKFNCELREVSNNIKIEIFDINGRFISQNINFHTSEFTKLNFDISNFKKGFYIIKIINDKEITFEKIIISD